jgi:hypothetical protein
MHRQKQSVDFRDVFGVTHLPNLKLSASSECSVEWQGVLHFGCWLLFLLPAIRPPNRRARAQESGGSGRHNRTEPGKAGCGAPTHGASTFINLRGMLDPEEVAIALVGAVTGNRDRGRRATAWQTSM